MSKNTKTAVQPLSENTRRAIIITAIIVVAIVILSVALALILKPAQNTPSDNNSSSTGSSSLTIRNGDFYYTGSDDTAYPKTAQNWNKYGYKAKESSSHDFESISTNENAVMGIVTTATSGDGDTWDTVDADLQMENITATNPGKYDDDLDDDNVYMIATRAGEKTAACILSDSFSVSSGKSVKITVRLNTEQLEEGSKAVIMVQDSTTSALSKYWYAYDFDAEKTTGWNEYEFYIFNRETSTKYIRVSVGLGNVYSGEEGLDLVDDQPREGSGVLFVDGITYEEVTANDYRTTVDDPEAENSTRFKVIENEDIEDESTYLTWDKQGNRGTDSTYSTSEEFTTAGEEYFPFTDRDDFYKAIKKDTEDSEESGEGEPETPTRELSGFKIYKLDYDETSPDGPIGFRLNASELTDKGTQNGIKTLYSLWYKDHHHISFWVRVSQANEVAEANIYVQSYEDGEWKDVQNGSWTSIVTSKEIDTDTNCGWQKYDIYIKPSAVEREISILVTLGNKESYTEQEIEDSLVPSGTLYVTSPAYEKISSKDYNNASSGTYSKKLDLIGVSATTSVTNGTFSTTNNSVTQPSGWSPAFAGDSMLYRDGKGDDEIEGINRKRQDVEGSQVLRGANADEALTYGKWDDEQGNILQIRNNVDTSFGYYSDNITLSARTIYALSVLAKGDNANFYLLNTDATLERSERVIARGKEAPAEDGTTLDEAALGQLIKKDKLENGWKRYYIIIMTGDESQAVRIALFNGSIDGKTLSQGDAYFDAVQMLSLGSYSTTENTENEDADKYIVNWSMSSYELNGKAITIKDFLTAEQIDLLVKVEALTLEENEEAKDGAFSGLLVDSKFLPDEEAWNAMIAVPETSTEEEENNTTATETEKTPVDLGLLFSVISSVALVAALLVVVVVKLYQNKKNKKRAA